MQTTDQKILEMKEMAADIKSNLMEIMKTSNPQAYLYYLKQQQEQQND